jgi:hypothetical protein
MESSSVVVQDSSIADHSPNGERKPTRESSPGESSPPLTKEEMWNLRRHLFTNGQKDVTPKEYDWGKLSFSGQTHYDSYVANTLDCPELDLEPWAAALNLCLYTGKVLDNVEPRIGQPLG